MNQPPRPLNRLTKQELIQVITDDWESFKATVGNEKSAFEKQITTLNNGVDTISQSQEHLTAELEKLSGSLKERNQEISTLKEREEALAKKINNLDTQETKIEKLRKKADELLASLNSIKETHSQTEHLETECNNAFKKIKNQHGEISGWRQEINDFYNNLFNDEESTEKTIQHFVNLINTQASEIDKTLDNFKNELKRAEENNNQIEALAERASKLLLSVTTANLAIGFKQAKRRYGSEPLANQMQSDEWEKYGGWKKFFAFIQSLDFTGIVFFILFGGVLGIICWLTYGIITNVGSSTNHYDIYRFLAQFGPIIPLTWIALYLNRVLNLRRKLYEEYNYKQGLMVLLIGLTAQKKNNPDFHTDEQLLDEILALSINQPSYIKEKPRYDNPLQLIINALRSKNTGERSEQTERENSSSHKKRPQAKKKQSPETTIEKSDTTP